LRLLALIALLAAPAVHAQMYKCVDARGVTQYSDKPCPDGKGREVDIRGQPPISGELKPQKENLKAAERDFQQRQAKQERERLQEQRALEAQQKRCTSLRDQLQRLSATRRPRDAAAHDARIAALNADIARVCR
jgi:Skp family chaperone for outer membrane proteins